MYSVCNSQCVMVSCLCHVPFLRGLVLDGCVYCFRFVSQVAHSAWPKQAGGKKEGIIGTTPCVHGTAAFREGVPAKAQSRSMICAVFPAVLGGWGKRIQNEEKCNGFNRFGQQNSKQIKIIQKRRI